MTSVGEVCQLLLQENVNEVNSATALLPIYIKNVRFRKFVQPGDQCVITAEIKEGDVQKPGSEIMVATSIMANDKRIMQAKMGFRILS